MFSSPPRGIYISTERIKQLSEDIKNGSRPLHGESIYLPTEVKKKRSVMRSRPLLGESIYLQLYVF